MTKHRYLLDPLWLRGGKTSARWKDNARVLFRYNLDKEASLGGRDICEQSEHAATTEEHAATTEEHAATTF